MGFSTQIFIFAAFPICMVCFILTEWLHRKGPGLFSWMRLRDWTLILFSLGFYGWACFDDMPKLVLYMLVVYVLGLLLERRRRKAALAAAVTTILLCLIYYKYWDFLRQATCGVLGIGGSASRIAAPLGISFITFSAVSYLVDVYKGRCGAGSVTDCLLYLSFFPKVVSGPIVLWRDFAPQIPVRRADLDQTVQGMEHLMIGFAKKVLLADQFGACIAKIGGSGVDVVTAWGAALLYMLQLYYDFAGYSDMAIGLCKLFGFEVKANFCFPYRSRSVSEFWRRWHISLGTWFREYVYFPLGGSRVPLGKNLRNLAVVFALTGIWHGAGWNYILWGCLNAVVVVAERLARDRKWYAAIPDWIKWAATMLFTLFCWELYRYQTVEQAARWIAIMFGLVRFDRVFYTWQYFFDAQILFLAAVGILGATVLGDERLRAWYGRVKATVWGYALQQVVLLVLFVLAVLFMVNSTYSPFIYFQY